MTSEWISVADRLPLPVPADPYGTETVIVLATDGNEVFQSEFFIYGERLASDESGCGWSRGMGCKGYGSGPVTHWMPMPRPPAQ